MLKNGFIDNTDDRKLDILKSAVNTLTGISQHIVRVKKAGYLEKDTEKAYLNFRAPLM